MTDNTEDDSTTITADEASKYYLRLLNEEKARHKQSKSKYENIIGFGCLVLLPLAAIGAITIFSDFSVRSMVEGAKYFLVIAGVLLIVAAIGWAADYIHRTW